MDLYTAAEMAMELPIPYTKAINSRLLGWIFFSFHLLHRLSVVSESCECLKNTKQQQATQGRHQVKINSEVIKNDPSYSKH